jgi:hypothetical protein
MEQHNRYRLIVVKDSYIYLQEWKYIEKRSNGNSLYEWKHIGCWDSNQTQEVLSTISETKRNDLAARYVDLSNYIANFKVQLQKIKEYKANKDEYKRLKKQIKRELNYQLV